MLVACRGEAGRKQQSLLHGQQTGLAVYRQDNLFSLRQTQLDNDAARQAPR